MPQEQENFQDAVRQILDVVIFENWIRFYFITEDDKSEDENGNLRIEIPEKSMEKIKELYPDFFLLAEGMNHHNVDFNTSMRAVLTYVLDNLDNKKMPRDMAQTVFSSATFQIRLQLFNVWVQSHEEQLDSHFLDFNTWRKLFEKWSEEPPAKKLAETIANARRA